MFLRLGLVAAEVLNIVDNKRVDALVEKEEAVGVAFCHGSGVLAFKQTGGDVKHAGVGIVFLYAYAYCLDKVCLAHAGRAEKEERVEGIVVRIGGYGLGYGNGHFV